MTGMFGLPGIPVASTTCCGRRGRALPLRSRSTVHSPFSGEYVAFVATVLPQYGTSMTFTYDSSQVADLALGREDRPVVGELEVRQLVAQPGSCRQSDLLR